MKRCVHLLAVIVALVVPVSATAVPVGSSVILAFGETYTSPAGTRLVHHGIDVACEPGDRVLSPVEGTVSFAGAIPAAGGGTMLAVSIKTGSGTVTLMPFETLAVRKGAEVSVSGPLGAVAGGGDASSPETHLHVGLKKGSLYVDPTHLLRVPPAAEADEQPATTPVPTPVPAPGRVPARTPTHAGAVQAVALAPAGVAVAAPAPSPAPAPVAGAEVSVGGTEPTLDSVRDGWVTDEVTRVRLRAASPVAAPSGWSTSPAGRAFAAALIACRDAQGAAVLVGTVLLMGLLLSRRVLRSAIINHASVSDRLGYWLQHLKAGDTLRGLTSCPGPLPSQSRGRIAQGR